MRLWGHWRENTHWSLKSIEGLMGDLSLGDEKQKDGATEAEAYTYELLPRGDDFVEFNCKC